MGNTSGREGQVVPGAGGSVGAEGGGHGNQVGNAHRLPQYVVPPSGHHHHHPNTIQDSTRIAQVASADSMGQSPSDSPGSAARSPLMFTPQVPMVPIAKPDEIGLGSHQQAQGLNTQPDLYSEAERGVPTMIVWNLGGNSVSVTGSWDNWSIRQPLQRTGRDFTLIKVLPSGVYQFKFFVDGQWRYSPDLPAVSDDTNNVNNILDVQDYVPENLDSVAGFEPPQSPESSYNDPMPGPEEFAKEPPAVPPHLHLTLLNVPQSMETTGSLPRPQHVILNHLYVEKGKSSRTVLVLGTTNRFRSKFVTTVLYKPVMV
ncbi:unnamed protein product [Sphagnum jensenii]|jgi:5'-AMP-activated protein kinase regulatory beta subunit|uniref:Uncharacterized protein n=2 Tax=Sphagnum jensenii TaxID=128206 RepID=A0ABP0W7L1_9BRYO